MADITYMEDAADVSPADLEGFFVGWPKHPTTETHLRLLEGSSHVVLAKEADGGRVVGFITAVSDGVLAAYIPLLEVLPEFQGQGIGRELVTRLLARLSDLYMIDLTCDPGLRPFYESLGLVAGSGMMKRNYANQVGRRLSSS